MYVKAPMELPEYYKEIIEDELNVKKVAFTNDTSEYTTYTFKPQLRTVGPKYRKFLERSKRLCRSRWSCYHGRAETERRSETGYSGCGAAELTEDDLLIETAQTKAM